MVLSDNYLMRIALLSHDIPGSSTSGVGSFTLHCAAALARAGHEAHIFTFHATEQTRRLVPAGVCVHSIPSLAEGVCEGHIGGPSGRVLGNAGQTGQLLAQAHLLCDAVREVHKKRPFDIVETPEVLFPGLPLLLHPIQGLPVVAMLHAGTAISRHFNEVPCTGEDELAAALEAATVLLADGLCAPTRAVVAATRRFIAFEGAVEVFPSPLPNTEFIAPAEDGPQDYVMFAGRIERLKGCCELALAANIFLAACPDARLRLYGPDRPLAGPPRIAGARLVSAASTREWMRGQLDPAVKDRVEFMGTTPPERMAAAYAGAKFIVAPSRFENFGTTAVEALVARRPVVYAAGTGLEEVVADAGLAADANQPGDLAAQMIRLWKDGGLRKDLAARAAGRLATELSIEHAVSRRLAFYETVRLQPRESLRGKSARLAGLGPAALQTLLSFSSGIVGRMAGMRSAVATSPGTRAAAALARMDSAGDAIRSLWLYPNGQHTRRLLLERSLIEQHGARIAGILDDAAAPDETAFQLPVLTRADAGKKLAAGAIRIDALVLSSDSIEEALWQNTEPFRRLNIPVARLYG